MKSRFEAVHGEDSFDGFVEVQRNYFDELWSELLFLRTDLGSK